MYQKSSSISNFDESKLRSNYLKGKIFLNLNMYVFIQHYLSDKTNLNNKLKLLEII